MLMILINLFLIKNSLKPSNLGWCGLLWASGPGVQCRAKTDFVAVEMRAYDAKMEMPLGYVAETTGWFFCFLWQPRDGWLAWWRLEPAGAHGAGSRLTGETVLSIKPGNGGAQDKAVASRIGIVG
ncbi:hypothetical protein METBIDRAFT_31379 [Metschnikowia bicuspidata var. bicuspidata NRRL YB-4993]|uniref:Uncharacterized protein n=1 Tax=Metschnikowia bicuspidata var. bicuspidata NRRL YB-4993 TaxID=869754 RepID=A0A1A0HEF0_9ASCO|nr:hypothetical protein METBIDRAFT_31379 [Metschnikowia bicuspidata var. bicuspidata NRRL YB-4993]OBA22489.1 hypothetical protein METBIDRAFT_31379 [Metschnikowia bicuspidata var. bicuspidata NRRL YB-4993]